MGSFFIGNLFGLVIPRLAARDKMVNHLPQNEVG